MQRWRQFGTSRTDISGGIELELVGESQERTEGEEISGKIGVELVGESSERTKAEGDDEIGGK